MVIKDALTASERYGGNSPSGSPIIRRIAYYRDADGTRVNVRYECPKRMRASPDDPMGTDRGEIVVYADRQIVSSYPFNGTITDNDIFGLGGFLGPLVLERASVCEVDNMVRSVLDLQQCAEESGPSGWFDCKSDGYEPDGMGPEERKHSDLTLSDIRLM